MLSQADLAHRPDFELGDLQISPARRRVNGPAGSRQVEPQFMLVFLKLLDAAPNVVTRMELFEECWGGAIVGDDSLNRAIAGARQIATSVGSNAFRIETVPRTGYVLQLAPGIELSAGAEADSSAEFELQTAVEDAMDCWRAGLPNPDHDAIRTLGAILSGNRGDARAWGIYALLLRKAAEYSEPGQCAAFVRQCEQAAKRALALVPDQSDARVALTSVVPLFGNWTRAREQLATIREADPDHVPAAHDMAILEMATGRPSAATPLVEQLIARDPLGATFHYKRMYHLWTAGDVEELEQVAARALQLWPRHPAIWTARLWTLVFTARAAQALRFLDEDAWRPAIPPLALDLLRRTCLIAAREQAGANVDPQLRADTVEAAVDAAARGPAQAVAALMSLCALDEIDAAFEVAYGYYLGRGRAVTPLRRGTGDPSITDQHRRITQPLFIPSARRMREDPRFVGLCEDMGLARYWEGFRITPDFLSPRMSRVH